jgi:flagellar biosynthesis protein FliQ
VVDWMMEQLITWIAGFILDALNTVVDILRNTAFVTPNVTALPQVTHIWALNLAITNALYVLAIVAGGVMAMTYETVQIRYAVKELAPRLVFGLVAGNFSLQWMSMILDFTNSLTQALTAQPIAGAGALDSIRAQVKAGLQNSTADVLAVIVGVFILILVIMLMFTWIVRFTVLLILAVSAPLALACHCLPQLDGVARLWWRTLFGTLGTQVLQALTLYTGLRIVLDPAANVPAMLGMGGGEVFNLFVLAILLWTTVKIPGLMRRLVLSGGGGGRNNVVGSVVRLVLVRRLFK